MPVKKRTYNTQRIKSNLSYTIGEITELFEIHKTSVRNWMKAGLQSIDKTRPYLIHGSDLKAFLNERQSKRKQPCNPHEFYCLKCRAPRSTWEGAIDINITSPKKLELLGLCSTCGTKVFKFGKVEKLPEYAKTFDVLEIQGQHIIERSHPALMCHFERTIKQ